MQVPKPGLPLPGAANGTRAAIMEYSVQLLLRLAQDSKQKGQTPFLPWQELQSCKVSRKQLKQLRHSMPLLSGNMQRFQQSLTALSASIESASNLFGSITDDALQVCQAASWMLSLCQNKTNRCLIAACAL